MSDEDKKSKHSGRPLTEEELKEHLNAFKGFEDSIDNLLKKENKRNDRIGKAAD